MKKKKKRKRKDSKKTKEKKKNLCVGKNEKEERKENGKSRPCTLRFSVFRRSKFVSPRIKVGLQTRATSRFQ